jgi:hypothetical protein
MIINERAGERWNSSYGEKTTGKTATRFAAAVALLTMRRVRIITTRLMGAKPFRRCLHFHEMCYGFSPVDMVVYQLVIANIY